MFDSENELTIDDETPSVFVPHSSTSEQTGHLSIKSLNEIKSSGDIFISDSSEAFAEMDSDHSESSDSESSDRCAICLGRLRGQLGSPDAFGCEHYFCLLCILEWAKNNPVCPQDRRPFETVLVRESVDGNIVETIPISKNEPEDESQSVVESSLTFCEVCGRSDREDSLLLCDGCDLGYHLDCLTPPLLYVPIEEWYCLLCQSVDLPQAVQDNETKEEIESSKIKKTKTRKEKKKKKKSKPRMIPRTRASEKVLQRIRRVRGKHYNKCENDAGNDTEGEGGKTKKKNSHVVQAFIRARPFGSINDDDIDAQFNEDKFAEKLLAKSSESFKNREECKQQILNSINTPSSSYMGRSSHPNIKEIKPSNTIDILSNILEGQSLLHSNSRDIIITDDRKLFSKNGINDTFNYDKENYIMAEPLPSQKLKMKIEKDSIEKESNTPDLHHEEDSTYGSGSNTNDRTEYTIDNKDDLRDNRTNINLDRSRHKSYRHYDHHMSRDKSSRDHISHYQEYNHRSHRADYRSSDERSRKRDREYPNNIKRLRRSRSRSKESSDSRSNHHKWHDTTEAKICSSSTNDSRKEKNTVGDHRTNSDYKEHRHRKSKATNLFWGKSSVNKETENSLINHTKVSQDISLHTMSLPEMYHVNKDDKLLGISPKNLKSPTMKRPDDSKPLLKSKDENFLDPTDGGKTIPHLVDEENGMEKKRIKNKALFGEDSEVLSPPNSAPNSHGENEQPTSLYSESIRCSSKNEIEQYTSSRNRNIISPHKRKHPVLDIDEKKEEPPSKSLRPSMLSNCSDKNHLDLSETYTTFYDSNYNSDIDIMMKSGPEFYMAKKGSIKEPSSVETGDREKNRVEWRDQQLSSPPNIGSVEDLNYYNPEQDSDDITVLSKKSRDLILNSLFGSKRQKYIPNIDDDDSTCASERMNQSLNKYQKMNLDSKLPLIDKNIDKRSKEEVANSKEKYENEDKSRDANVDSKDNKLKEDDCNKKENIRRKEGSKECKEKKLNKESNDKKSKNKNRDRKSNNLYSDKKNKQDSKDRNMKESPSRKSIKEKGDKSRDKSKIKTKHKEAKKDSTIENYENKDSKVELSDKKSKKLTTNVIKKNVIDENEDVTSKSRSDKKSKRDVNDDISRSGHKNEAKRLKAESIHEKIKTDHKGEKSNVEEIDAKPSNQNDKKQIRNKTFINLFGDSSDSETCQNSGEKYQEISSNKTVNNGTFSENKNEKENGKSRENKHSKRNSDGKQIKSTRDKERSKKNEKENLVNEEKNAQGATEVSIEKETHEMSYNVGLTDKHKNNKEIERKGIVKNDAKKHYKEKVQNEDNNIKDKDTCLPIENIHNEEVKNSVTNEDMDNMKDIAIYEEKEKVIQEHHNKDNKNSAKKEFLVTVDKERKECEKESIESDNKNATVIPENSENEEFGRNQLKIDQNQEMIKDKHQKGSPSGKSEMQQSTSLSKLDRINLETKVVEEAKRFLNPYYMEKLFSKDVYKEIVSKCVHKVLGAQCTTIVEPKKIQKLVDGYVQLHTYRSHKKSSRTTEGMS